MLHLEDVLLLVPLVLRVVAGGPGRHLGLRRLLLGDEGGAARRLGDLDSGQASFLRKTSKTSREWISSLFFRRNPPRKKRTFCPEHFRRSKEAAGEGGDERAMRCVAALACIPLPPFLLKTVRKKSPRQTTRNGKSNKSIKYFLLLVFEL